MIVFVISDLYPEPDMSSSHPFFLFIWNVNIVLSSIYWSLPLPLHENCSCRCLPSHAWELLGWPNQEFWVDSINLSQDIVHWSVTVDLVISLQMQCVTLAVFLSWCRAIAASAPIFQFSGLTPCEAFSQIVTSDYSAASTECAASIHKSWAEINNITSSGNSNTSLCNVPVLLSSWCCVVLKGVGPTYVSEEHTASVCRVPWIVTSLKTKISYVGHTTS
jgi:hypothetical protein